MALTNISKHCVVVTTFLLVLCGVAMIEEFELFGQSTEIPAVEEEIIALADEDVHGGDEDKFLEALDEPYAQLIFVAVIMMACILMITGIVKRNILCMVPFWLCAIVGVLASAYKYLPHFEGFEVFDITSVIGLLAAYFVLLFPYSAVIGEVRKEHAAKRVRCYNA